MGPSFRMTLQTGTRRQSLPGVLASRAPGKGHCSPAHGSFLAEKHMRAAAVCDLPSCRIFHVFHHTSGQERLKCQ